MSRVGKSPEGAQRRSPRLLKVITTPIKNPQAKSSTKKETSPVVSEKKGKSKRTPEPSTKSPETHARLNSKEEKKASPTTKKGKGKNTEVVVPVVETKKRKTPEKPVEQPQPAPLIKSPTVTRVQSEEQQQKVYSSPELHTMSRLEIQRIARTLNIPTNQKTEVLVQLISDQACLLCFSIVCDLLLSVFSFYSSILIL
jgi:hypothetical protein